jgi:hypothetical protein
VAIDTHIINDGKCPHLSTITAKHSQRGTKPAANDYGPIIANSFTDLAARRGFIQSPHRKPEPV